MLAEYNHALPSSLIKTTAITMTRSKFINHLHQAKGYCGDFSFLSTKSGGEKKGLMLWNKIFRSDTTKAFLPG